MPDPDLDRALSRVVADYVAAWNSADESDRRALLERSFAADGRYLDPAARIEGREALVGHARQFATRWPGAVIEQTSAVDVHRDGACFTWRVRGPDGGTVHEGIDVVIAGPDGRLREVRGFFGAYRSPYPRPR
jgi:hypothetical protein